MDLATSNVAAGNYFENLGGTFRKITPFASTFGWGCAWIDADNDRDLDFYMATDAMGRGTPKDKLFRNLGAGTFDDVSAALNGTACEDAVHRSGGLQQRRSPGHHHGQSDHAERELHRRSRGRRSVRERVRERVPVELQLDQARTRRRRTEGEQRCHRRRGQGHRRCGHPAKRSHLRFELHVQRGSAAPLRTRQHHDRGQDRSDLAPPG